MIHHARRKTTVVIALFACAAALGACGKKDEATAILGSNDSVLRFVPADTPYAIVNPQPLDDGIVNKMTGESSAILASYEIVMRESLTAHSESLPPDDPERVEAERVAAVAGELMNLFSLEGMRDAGFDVNESFAVYGHGLLPVMRARLLDEDRFEAAVSRIEAEAGESLDTASLDGQTYRYILSDGTRFILGAFGDYVVMTFAPESFGDDELALLTGMELPDKSLADAGTLATIARDYGYLSNYIGFVDVRRIAKTLVGDRTGLDEALFAAAEFDEEEFSEVCREEFMEMAGIAPRAVFGYSKLDLDSMAGSLVVELRPDLALGLTALPAPVPGLGIDHGGLFSFGMSLNPGAFRDFYSAQLDALESDPFECEHFADLQADVAQGRQALAQPIPPVAYGFRGLIAVVDDVDMAALAANVPPMDMDATFMLAIEDAPQLMMMGTMFSPELAELGIEPDGEPVALDVPQAGMLPQMPYAALTDNLLAVAAGENAESRITSLMQSESSEPPPLMSIAGDAGRYYEMVGQTMADDMGPDGEQLSPAARAAIQESMQSLAEVYDRMLFDIRLTERGIEFDAAMSFKD